MIGYAMIGTNDLAKARAFYDEVFAPLGAAVIDAFSDERHVFYGNGGQSLLSITKPYDGGAASVGNGTMMAIQAKDRGQVHAVHAKALALGGANEGDPGLRGEPFYGAYFRDLDGNKLAVFTFAKA